MTHPTKTAALPPGLGTAVARRAGIGAAGGAVAGAAGGALNAEEGRGWQGALQGGAIGATVGGTLGAASGALHKAPEIARGQLAARPSIVSGSGAGTLSDLARAAESARIGGLNRDLIQGSYGVRRMGDAMVSKPALAAGALGTAGLGAMVAPGSPEAGAPVKMAYSALESALLHAADGAALGGITGAVAGGEGHRMEGAGRGALAGAAMGGGLHALHGATLKARGLTPGAIDASAERAVEQARAEAMEGLKDLNKTTRGEFTLDDFIHAKGQGPVAQEIAFDKRVDTRKALHDALDNAPNVGSALRKTLVDKNMQQHALYTAGHYGLPTVAGGVAGYTTPGESKQAGAAAQVAEDAVEHYPQLRQALGNMLGGGLEGTVGGGAVGALGGAAAAGPDHRMEGAYRGALPGAALGAGLGLAHGGLRGLSPGTADELSTSTALAQLLGGGALGYRAGMGSGAPSKQANIMTSPVINYARGAGSLVGSAAKNVAEPIMSVAKAAAYVAGQRRGAALLRM